MVAHLAAIALGFSLDRLMGDPPDWPHPVRWIGSLIHSLTGKLNRERYAFRNGFVMLGIVLSIVVLVSFSLVYLAFAIHWSIGLVVEALLIAAGLSRKSLKQAAEDVYQPLIQKDLPLAREKLAWIVGRDTEHLDESEITRGVVETVSENTSDGVTAPLFWAFLFGAPGLWFYKAVNTCDSMVGYKREEFSRFGYASAKLDDVLNFVPSRITGFLILVTTKNERSLTFGQRFKQWLRDAKKHPSPNSGYLEAATAIQMGIELGGTNTYKGIRSERARMGTAVYQLEAGHIEKAISEMLRVSLWFFILFMIGGILIAIA